MSAIAMKDLIVEVDGKRLPIIGDETDYSFVDSPTPPKEVTLNLLVTMDWDEYQKMMKKMEG